MPSRRRRFNLLAALLVTALVAACGPAYHDDGHLFLLSHAAEWRLPTPAARSGVRPTPLPYATTGASSAPSATPPATRQPTIVPRVRQTPIATTPTATTPTAPAVTRPAPPTATVSSNVAGTPVANRGLVYLDPGHGGVDEGAVGYTSDGTPVLEKTLTLAIVQRTAARLRDDGITVTLSRSEDGLPGSTPADYSPDGNMLTPDGVLADLQRRIDRANAAGARVFLSVHLNAYSDPSVGGSETFYDSARPFADENERFAQLVQSSLIGALRAHGYMTPDRGITDDASLQTEDLGALQGAYNHLVLLGPAVPGKLRPTQMAGALSEPMFVSDPDEAAALTQPDVQNLLAGAYAEAIEQFLKS